LFKTLFSSPFIYKIGPSLHNDPFCRKVFDLQMDSADHIATTVSKTMRQFKMSIIDLKVIKVNLRPLRLAINLRWVPRKCSLGSGPRIVRCAAGISAEEETPKRLSQPTQRLSRLLFKRSVYFVTGLLEVFWRNWSMYTCLNLMSLV